MHKRTLTKPDGRPLLLYAREPIARDHERAEPRERLIRTPATRHLRWHPLRGEWVAYASHRQNRTFLPPAEYNPLAPTTDPINPTEVPAGGWDVAVFENLFPTLARDRARSAGASGSRPRPGTGSARSSCSRRTPRSSSGRLPLWHLELLIEVWARSLCGARRAARRRSTSTRSRTAASKSASRCIIRTVSSMPIRSCRRSPARELEQQRAYYEQHGRGLIEDLVAREVAEGVRMLYDGSEAAAFMPICARYSYEVWVAPQRAAASFAALTPI